MKKLLIIATLFFIPILSFSQYNKEESAIKILLEKESATWRNGDAKAHADCWHIQSYSRILVSTADGKSFDVPPQNIITPPNNKMGDGGSSTNSNYTFSIHGNYAWVSHDEESISKTGEKSFSYEIRMLEKISGEWKLVGQSIHIHK
jgi:hypothetical protein